MITSLLTFALMATTPLTPEQEVEAWQPTYVEKKVDPQEQRARDLAAASYVVPLVAFVGATASGIVAGLVLGGVVGVVIGSAAFAAYLAAGHWLFLPDDVPRWTSPVAVIASTLSAGGGVVGGFVAATALMPALQQPGNDCFGCGPQVLLYVVLPVALGTAGGICANAVVVNVADANRE